MMRYRIGELLGLIDNLCCSRSDYSDEGWSLPIEKYSISSLRNVESKRRIQLNERAAFIQRNAHLMFE